ncbi:hypothetical protein RJ641_032257 [Dillenia turbinata]|uniref:Uncharacterized protein n=1 Tax=Dillenia turbinata TaxID=194707 RepID=A0AAN8VVX0_9MAGN
MVHSFDWARPMVGHNLKSIAPYYPLPRFHAVFDNCLSLSFVGVDSFSQSWHHGGVCIWWTMLEGLDVSLALQDIFLFGELTPDT